MPIWEKFNLTIEEASEYFNIGENKLRRIIAEYETDIKCDFILKNGVKTLIKRKKFEEFINKTISI